MESVRSIASFTHMHVCSVPREEYISFQMDGNLSAARAKTYLAVFPYSSVEYAYGKESSQLGSCSV